MTHNHKLISNKQAGMWPYAAEKMWIIIEQEFNTAQEEQWIKKIKSLAVVENIREM